MESKRKSILIALQGTPGGTDLLLARLGRHLANHDSVSHVHCSKIDDLPRNAFEMHWDIVIIPSSNLWRLNELLQLGHNFGTYFVWCMGLQSFHGAWFFAPQNTNRLVQALGSIYDRCSSRAFRLLVKYGRIVFTDECAWNEALFRSRMKLDPKHLSQIVPIVPEIQTQFERRATASVRENTINITWLGRIDNDFKLHSLRTTLVQIEAFGRASKYKLRFTAIGSGNATDDVDALGNSLNHVEYSRVPNVPYSQLHRFLQDNSDIIFAMGTSALDGALAGVPSVVVRPFRTDHETITNAFRWAHESRGLSLGEFSGAFCYPRQPSTTALSILEELIREPQAILEKSDRFIKQFSSHRFDYFLQSDCRRITSTERLLFAIIQSEHKLRNLVKVFYRWATVNRA